MISISNYNSLQVNLQRRLYKRIHFGLTHTYGKTLTDITGVGTSGGLTAVAVADYHLPDSHELPPSILLLL